MGKIQIQKYKVGDFIHYVPKPIDKSFKDAVKEAGKSAQSIDSNYISPSRYQESCDNSAMEVIENEIFHPPNKLLIETIQEINIQIYKVSDSEKDDFIIHCPLDDRIANLTNHIKFNDAQSEEIERYSLTIKEYRDKCKNPEDNENFVDIDEDLKIYDPIASEFELLNNNNIEKLTMTTSTPTPTKPQDQTSVNTEEENLMKYLGSCTRAFLDELILTFNDKEALKQYQYAHSTKKKQNVMYQIVTKDLEKGSEQLTAIKDFHDYVQGEHPTF